jgi:uncharacterized membrane protein YoaT (DUF817 family)
LKQLQALDEHLLQNRPVATAKGFVRFALEFWYFGVKEARACLFAGLFFFSVFAVPKAGIVSIPRYDVLLIIAIAIQAWMIFTKLESIDELKAVCVFHLVGFALEVFKTSSGIKSWAYPDFAYTKIFGVPLFSGFMYAAVGSYIIQAWRLFDLRIKHHPPYWMAGLIAGLIYANFFTHHFIGDYRWYFAAAALGLYARSTVIFRPLDKDRLMGLWKYPNQLGAWSNVHIGKWSSWSLLVIMTFTIVANLKHIRKKIDVPT